MIPFYGLLKYQDNWLRMHADRCTFVCRRDFLNTKEEYVQLLFFCSVNYWCTVESSPEGQKLENVEWWPFGSVKIFLVNFKHWAGMDRIFWVPTLHRCILSVVFVMTTYVICSCVTVLSSVVDPELLLGNFWSWSDDWGEDTFQILSSSCIFKKF